MNRSCSAMVHHHIGNYPCSGSPRKYESRRCQRSGTKLRLNDQGGFGVFCTQHARLADEGFIDRVGMMPSPQSMADYRKYPGIYVAKSGRVVGGFVHGFTPPHRGVWAEAVRKEQVLS